MPVQGIPCRHRVALVHLEKRIVRPIEDVPGAAQAAETDVVKDVVKNGESCKTDMRQMR